MKIYLTHNEILEDFWRKKKMKSKYERYMEKRSELIKQGKGLAEATNTAFEIVYQQKITGEELLSPANQ